MIKQQHKYNLCTKTKSENYCEVSHFSLHHTALFITLPPLSYVQKHISHLYAEEKETLLVLLLRHR